MAEIREVLITEPPTSGEVQDLAISSLHAGIMRLTIIGRQEIPRPAEEDVEFRIRQTVHPDEGGMMISGETETGLSIVVRAPEDSTQQATASIAS